MPCKIEDIPVVDAVIISHNHYDHLSYPTIKQLHDLHPNCHFFAPLGNKQWFTRCGIENMTELDWWEERDITLAPSKSGQGAINLGETNQENKATLSDILGRIGCLPSQHTSSRTLWDRSKTLWSSWSVESGGCKVYFAG
jgi:L-ascorbate metabolism protein UlaG (beta-lactamase superfamily)